MLEDGALRIRNIKKSDDGIYSCRAEVDADGRYDERKISVVVHGLFTFASFHDIHIPLLKAFFLFLVSIPIDVYL